MEQLLEKYEGIIANFDSNYLAKSTEDFFVQVKHVDEIYALVFEEFSLILMEITNSQRLVSLFHKLFKGFDFKTKVILEGVKSLMEVLNTLRENRSPRRRSIASTVLKVKTEIPVEPLKHPATSTRSKNRYETEDEDGSPEPIENKMNNSEDSKKKTERPPPKRKEKFRNIKLEEAKKALIKHSEMLDRWNADFETARLQLEKAIDNRQDFTFKHKDSMARMDELLFMFKKQRQKVANLYRSCEDNDNNIKHMFETTRTNARTTVRVLNQYALNQMRGRSMSSTGSYWNTGVFKGSIMVHDQEVQVDRDLDAKGNKQKTRTKKDLILENEILKSDNLISKKQIIDLGFHLQKIEDEIRILHRNVGLIPSRNPEIGIEGKSAVIIDLIHAIGQQWVEVSLELSQLRTLGKTNTGGVSIATQTTRKGTSPKKASSPAKLGGTTEMESRMKGEVLEPPNLGQIPITEKISQFLLWDDIGQANNHNLIEKIPIPNKDNPVQPPPKVTIDIATLTDQLIITEAIGIQTNTLPEVPQEVNLANENNPPLSSVRITNLKEDLEKLENVGFQTFGASFPKAPPSNTIQYPTNNGKPLVYKESKPSNHNEQADNQFEVSTKFQLRTPNKPTSISPVELQELLNVRKHVQKNPLLKSNTKFAIINSDNRNAPTAQDSGPRFWQQPFPQEDNVNHIKRLRISSVGESFSRTPNPRFKLSLRSPSEILDMPLEIQRMKTTTNVTSSPNLLTKVKLRSYVVKGDPLLGQGEPDGFFEESENEHKALIQPNISRQENFPPEIFERLQAVMSGKKSQAETESILHSFYQEFNQKLDSFEVFSRNFREFAFHHGNCGQECEHLAQFMENCIHHTEPKMCRDGWESRKDSTGRLPRLRSVPIRRIRFLPIGS